MSNKITRRKFISSAALATAGIASAYDSKIFANLLKSEKQKIFIFSKHLQWLDYDDMAEMAKQFGFDGVDLTVRPGGHVLPENVEWDLPKAVEAIRKRGLIVDTITTAITDAKDPSTLRIIKYASKLGIKQYRMGWHNYEENLSIPQNLDIIQQKFNALNTLNAEYKIRADYQNHSGDGFGATIWDICQIYKDIDTSWLGIRYDIRHATVEGGTSWKRTMQLAKPFIKSLDIKDFLWSYNSMKDEYYVKNTPLGEGMVNFKQYFQIINKDYLDKSMTLHLEYELGGANEGSSTLNISVDEFKVKVKKDLAFIKNHQSL